MMQFSRFIRIVIAVFILSSVGAMRTQAMDSLSTPSTLPQQGGGISVTTEEVEAMKERLAKMEEAEKEAAAKAAKLAEELKQADEVREREGPHASYEPEHPHCAA